jgi:hypothetical protein
MKREFMKGFTMLVLVVMLALSLAVVSANGQSTANRVVANVPFEFSVGYKALPAGAYSVQSIVSCDGLLIQSADGKTSALRLSEATRQIKEKPKARLVFHRYGERYFLAEVWQRLASTQALRPMLETKTATQRPRVAVLVFLPPNVQSQRSKVCLPEETR